MITSLNFTDRQKVQNAKTQDAVELPSFSLAAAYQKSDKLVILIMH